MTPLSYAQARSNYRWNAIELIFAAPFIVVMQQYVPVLITRLGASPLWLGLLTSGAALMLTVASALAPRWIAAMRTYRRSMAVALLIYRSIMLLIPLVLFLAPLAVQSEIIVLLALLLSLFAGMGNMTLTAYLPRMTMSDALSQLVSMRWVVLGLCMAIFTPAIAWILDRFQQPDNYIVACVIALVAGMLGIAPLMMIKPVPDGPLAKQAARDGQARTGLRTMLAHKAARSYLLLTLLVQFALNAPVPLITLQMVRGLRLTDSQFGWYLAIFWISLAIAGMGVARVVRRYGNARAFAVSTIALAGQVVVLAFATSFQATWIAGLLGGVASVFFQVSAYALLVDCAPPDNYEGFMSVHAAVTNFCIFAAPLAISALLETGLIGIFGGLLLTALLRGVAGVLALRMKEGSGR